MTSERTKKLRKWEYVFSILDVLTWVGVAIFTIVSVFCLIDAKDSSGVPIFSDDFKKTLVSLGVTTIVGIICALLIKDKIRVAVWMLSLILCSIMYKDVGMYCILGAWFIDEYIFNTIKNHCKTRLIINKEIDLRG